MIRRRKTARKRSNRVRKSFSAFTSSSERVSGRVREGSWVAATVMEVEDAVAVDED